MQTVKWIIVTGGVLSGLGKGVACASIGRLLANKYSILPIKCDGYLNVDPGTMNPIEHGEVFVLDDGGEVDMDFGHYERFIGVNSKVIWNLTMGKVFDIIRQKERRGDFLGKTVQLIPHVTDLIKHWYKDLAKKEKADIIMIEIGGTVGDIENELFLEACRQLRRDVGDENIMYIHLTYVPIPYGVNEQKSKPTQQSIKLLNMMGIFPNVIIGRCSEFITDKIKEKIAMFCEIDKASVITGKDTDNIYKLPLIFDKEGLSKIISTELNIEVDPDLDQWNKLVTNMGSAKKDVVIAICGKYTKLEDSYASIIEALNHCQAHLKHKVKVRWVETTDLTDTSSTLKDVDGVIVPGGFGSRGVEGKIKVIEHCRKKGIPFLGICYGMQLAVAEFARNVCELEGANSTEIDPKTKHPVIDILPEQKTIKDKGGTMRLGAYPAVLKKGTKIAELYGSTDVSERHRHRFEVNPEYHKILTEKGMVFSGMSPNRKLVEFIELPNHPYFTGTQGHPELKSSLLKPAPLFFGLVEAAIKKRYDN